MPSPPPSEPLSKHGVGHAAKGPNRSDIHKAEGMAANGALPASALLLQHLMVHQPPHHQQQQQQPSPFVGGAPAASLALLPPHGSFVHLTQNQGQRLALLDNAGGGMIAAPLMEPLGASAAAAAPLFPRLPVVPTPPSQLQQHNLQQALIQQQQQARMVRALMADRASSSQDSKADYVAEATANSKLSEASLATTTATELSEVDRVRFEKNRREQERSNRINRQIKELHDLLVASKVPLGADDKYSILFEVDRYIQQLQRHAVVLDSEHVRLLETIRLTTRVMEGKSTTEGSSNSCSFESASSLDSDMDDDDDENIAATTVSDDDGLLFSGADGLDYAAVFRHCPHPLGLASLDGTMLASNLDFEALLNPIHGKSSMKGQSFFLYIRNHQDVFRAMSTLLEQSMQQSRLESKETPLSRQPLYWYGPIQTSRNETACITLTLANTAKRSPSYFCIFASASSK